MSKYARLDTTRAGTKQHDSASSPSSDPSSASSYARDGVNSALAGASPFGSGDGPIGGDTTGDGDGGMKPPPKPYFYLHRNGHLINSILTPLPAASRGWQSAPPPNPRVGTADWFPCPTGNHPNPCETYHYEVSGFEQKPTVSLWNWLTFGWASALIATGYKRDIDQHDLHLLPEQYSAPVYTKRIFDAWHQNRHVVKNRFAWSIWHAYGSILRYMWVLKMIIIALTLARPILLSTLLRGVTNGAETSTSLLLIFALTCVSMIQALSVHHFWWYGVAVAMSSRGACIGLVYDKSLKLHSCERAVYTSGRISNLANVDVSRWRKTRTMCTLCCQLSTGCLTD